MRVAVGDDGTEYLLVTRSDGSWLVRDPATGTTRYLPADRLDVVDDVGALDVAAGAVDDSVRSLLALVHDDRSLGLLLELADRGPLSVRTMLAAYDFCESDLHGRLVSWRAGGLIEEADVGGERGYRVTDECNSALARLRGGSDPDRSG